MTNYEIALLISAAAIYLGAVALVVRIRTRGEDPKTASLQGQHPKHVGKDDRLGQSRPPDSNAPADCDPEATTHIYDFLA